jgi:glycosyltransferase involved in cell wall biosynthesis
MNPKPKISVLMITYNHARFIRQALDSVLTQQTDFPYEVVIGDDASVDGTGAILAEYAGKFPDRIRLLLRTNNIGMNANLADTLATCRGEYVALLEGDDYWIGSGKLARQAGFLDGHPECPSCFHNAVVISDDAKVSGEGYYAQPDGRYLMCAPDLPSRISQSDLLKRNYIPTCSAMFRRSSAGKLPPWFVKLPLGDQPLHILCTEHGPAAYLPEVMGAYRLHGSSVWSNKTQLHRVARTLEMQAELERHFSGRPQGAILWVQQMGMLQGYARLLSEHGQPGDAAAAAAAYWRRAIQQPWFCLKHLSSLRRMSVLILKGKFSRTKKS